MITIKLNKNVNLILKIQDIFTRSKFVEMNLKNCHVILIIDVLDDMIFNIYWLS